MDNIGDTISTQRKAIKDDGLQVAGLSVMRDAWEDNVVDSRRLARPTCAKGFW